MAVVAFPKPEGSARTPSAEEKSLYFRPPFSSWNGVKAHLADPAGTVPLPSAQCVPLNRVVDLTDKLDATGRLRWDVPPGDWSVIRLGRTLTGQTTRPAPSAGLGFETDKFSAAAVDHHFAAYLDKLLPSSPPTTPPSAGLTRLHFDSWEMGAQNWSPDFREAFRKRRGYDPLPYLPAMLGHVIGSPQITERFLWDLRQTAQELIVGTHVSHLRDLAHQHGLSFSCEPYDLNPSADLALGMTDDEPMGEFWSTGHGYATEYSLIEAASIGHTMGRPVIGAESFTSTDSEPWLQYPGSMKAQADGVLCTGINHFVIHRYQHQPRDDEFPGLTMGPYGVHWERTETWWDFVPAFHQYLTRCSQVLREGLPVADILYLTPEGAPLVFRPPPSATRGPTQDHLGYNFDGCAPDVLLSRVTMHNGELTLPEGSRYRVLVLPEATSMTPVLLHKIAQLLNDGATVIGQAPIESPSLAGYPRCDEEVRALTETIWGTGDAASRPGERRVGKGRLFVDPVAATYPTLYPDYTMTAQTLQGLGVAPDFEADIPLRFIHRHVGASEAYFVSNGTDTPVAATCRFRAVGQPQWWQPLTGECRPLTQWTRKDGITTVPLQFDASGSGFVVFVPGADAVAGSGTPNFPKTATVATVGGPWQVSFDKAWGGPAQTIFQKLEDWTTRPEPGLRDYSGKAVYTAALPASPESLASSRPGFLSLGNVKVAASVRLNGVDLGVAWCAPWRVPIPAGVLKPNNELQITVANLWGNRLMADAGLPEAQRLSKTSWNPFHPGDARQPSGLIGPVEWQVETK